MARNSELKNYNGAGAKELEFTSSSPHNTISSVHGVNVYNGTSEEIVFTVSKSTTGSSGYKIVGKVTVGSEGNRGVCGHWHINDVNDKLKITWTQAADNVNATYSWQD